MIQRKIQTLLFLLGLFSLSCMDDPIWDQVTTGRPPIDGTWEGPTVGYYADRKTTLIVDGNGTKVTYFAIYPGFIGMGVSMGMGWEIVNSTFEITYSGSPAPGSYSFRGKVTGRFTSSKAVEGKYDLQEINYPYSYGPRSMGTWRAQWHSSSVDH